MACTLVLATTGVDASPTDLSIRLDEQSLPLDGSELWIGAMASGEKAMRTLFIENRGKDPLELSFAESEPLKAAGGLRTQGASTLVGAGKTGEISLLVDASGFGAEPAEHSLELRVRNVSTQEEEPLQALTFSVVTQRDLIGSVQDLYGTYERYTVGSGRSLVLRPTSFNLVAADQFTTTAVEDVLTFRQEGFLDISLFVVPGEDGQPVKFFKPQWQDPPADALPWKALVGPTGQRRTIEDMLWTSVPGESPPGHDRISHMTTYRVEVELDGETREYGAAVLWGGLTSLDIRDYVAEDIDLPSRSLTPAATKIVDMEAFEKAEASFSVRAPGDDALLGEKAGGSFCGDLPPDLATKTLDGASDRDDANHTQGILEILAGLYSGHGGQADLRVDCECSSSCQQTCRASVSNFNCWDFGPTTARRFHYATMDDTDGMVRHGRPATCTAAAECVVTMCQNPDCATIDANLEVDLEGLVKFTFGGVAIPDNVWTSGPNFELPYTCPACPEALVASISVTGNLPAGVDYRPTLSFENPDGSETVSGTAQISAPGDYFFTDAQNNRVTGHAGQIYRLTLPPAVPAYSCELAPGTKTLGEVPSGINLLEFSVDCCTEEDKTACGGGDTSARATVNWRTVVANTLDAPPPNDPDTVVTLTADSFEESREVIGSGSASFPAVASGEEFQMSISGQPRSSDCIPGPGNAGVADGSPIRGSFSCVQYVLPSRDDCNYVPAACVAPPQSCHWNYEFVGTTYSRRISHAVLVFDSDGNILSANINYTITRTNHYRHAQTCYPAATAPEGLPEKGAVVSTNPEKTTVSRGPIVSVRLDPNPTEPFIDPVIPLIGFASNPDSPMTEEVRVFIDEQPATVIGLELNLEDPFICDELGPEHCVRNSRFSGFLDISQLAPGRHTLQVWAKSANGLWSSTAVPLLVEPKIAPNCDPVDGVELTSPPPGSSYNHGDTVTLTATAEDNQGIDRIAFYADSRLIGADHTAPYEIDWQAEGGTEKLKARAYSTCGSFEASVLPVHVVGGPVCDGVVEEARLLLPDSRTSFVAGEAVTLQAEASDPSGIEKVHFVADGELLFTDREAPYRTTWIAEAGVSTLKARAYSVCDNTSFAVDSAQIQITEPAPCDGSVDSVAWQAPASGAVLSAGMSTVLSVAAEDGSGIAFVRFYADGELIGEDSSLPFSLQWTATDEVSSLTAEAYSLCATNPPAVATLPISVDTDGGSCDGSVDFLDLEMPADGATLIEDTAVILSASASDPSGVDRVEFFADGTLIAVDDTAPYTAAWTASSPGDVELSARAYSACDGASSSVDHHRLTVLPNLCDGTTDLVELTSPRHGEVSWAGTPMGLAAEAADGAGIDRVEFFVNSTLVATDTTAPYGTTWLAHASGTSVTARAYSTCPDDTHAWDRVEVTVEPPPDPWQIHWFHSCRGRVCTFDATASTRDDLRFTWNFGDGVQGAGSEVTHVYPGAGPFNVQLVATDPWNQGKVAYGSISLLDSEPDVLAASCTEPTTFSSQDLTSNDRGSASVLASIPAETEFGSFILDKTDPANPRVTFVPVLCPLDARAQYELRSTGDPAVSAPEFLRVTVPSGLVSTCDDDRRVCHFRLTETPAIPHQSVSWDFGDDQTASGGLSQTHFYSGDRRYTVSVTILTAAGHTVVLQDQVTVGDPRGL